MNNNSTVDTVLDWQAIAEQAPPPEPKTLLECLAEAGGFPFVARAVRDSKVLRSIPTGTEIRVLSGPKLSRRGVFVDSDFDPSTAWPQMFRAGPSSDTGHDSLR